MAANNEVVVLDDYDDVMEVKADVIAPSESIDPSAIRINVRVSAGHMLEVGPGDLVVYQLPGHTTEEFVGRITELNIVHYFTLIFRTFFHFLILLLCPPSPPEAERIGSECSDFTLQSKAF
jgi:hypothetical protein